MQLETIKNSMFALNALEAAAVFGGQIAPVRSFEERDTFYLDGTVRSDVVQTD